MSGILDILLDEFSRLFKGSSFFVLVQKLVLFDILFNCLVSVVDLSVRMTFHVLVDDEASQPAVVLGIRSVLHHCHQIEAGKNRLGEVDVVSEGDLLAVDASHWVGCGNH